MKTTKNITTWIIPCNDSYDIEKAYRNYQIIDWKQSINVNVGDVVYIYKTNPYKCIRYKCDVVKVDKQVSTIDDSNCVIDGTKYVDYGRYMELKFVHQYNYGLINYNELQKHNLKTVQGPIKVQGELLKYIESCHSNDKFEQAVNDFINYVESQPQQKGELFVDFNSGYLKEEEGYKKDLYKEARLKINNEDTLLNSVSSLLSSSKNNLVDYHQITHFKNVVKEKPNEAKRVLCDIYFGNDDKKAFEQATDLFGKKYDLIAFLFFLKDANQYLPIRPTRFKTAFERVDYAHLSTCTDKCEYDNYLVFCNFIKLLSETILPEYFDCNISPLDAHSFMWILSPAKNAKEIRYVKKKVNISIDDKVFEKQEDNRFIEELINSDIKREVFEYTRTPSEKKEKVQTNNHLSYPRSQQVAKNALNKADFKCEIDSNHETFIRKSNDMPYTEPHHLVPLSYCDQFDVSLDVEENVVSLCSNCHNNIHYGKDANKLIAKLYYERKGLLESVGIFVNLQDLIDMYE